MLGCVGVADDRVGKTTDVDPFHRGVSFELPIMKMAERRELIYETSTSFGKIAIGSAGDDVYRGDYFMIFDPGGEITASAHRAWKAAGRGRRQLV